MTFAARPFLRLFQSLFLFPPHHRTVLMGISLMLTVCFCAPSHAATGTPLAMKTEDERAITWNLTADRVVTLSDSEILEAHGNVILKRGNEYLKADYARYYITTNWVFLKGNVAARMGKDEMKAQEAEFDLRSRVGWLKQGEIFMDGPHIYMAGEHINKHWGDVYTFKKAKITACDGDVPAWSIMAEEAVVELDGYAQLWKSKFQVKDVPVAYTPWMIMPAKKDRQSGLLPPEYGHSSRLGYFYNQPAYWAIDSSRDLTVNEYYMSDRGLMQGVQYRSRPTASTGTWFRGDWLYDSKRVTNDNDDPINDRDGLVRKNRDRYWVRGMIEETLPGDPKWKFRADLDIVSDQNYLHEFKKGFSGFSRSQKELYEFFHRDLRERDLSRSSGVLLYRDWERISVALSAKYLQNPAFGNGNLPLSRDTTVQQLPMANIYLQKGAVVPSFPLEIGASTEAGYMYRRNGTQGTRYTAIPVATLPLHSRYGSVIASAGLHQAFYNSTRETRDGTRQPKQFGDSQTVPEYRVDGSTEFMRAYTLNTTPLVPSSANVGETRWQAIRHTVQPRVGYANTPYVDQSRNPRYDTSDRLRGINELTYSVTNILTRKRQRVHMAPPKKAGEQPTPQVNTEFLDILRLKLEQGYDIREATRSDDRDKYARRPYSDIMGEATVNLNDYVGFVNRTFWSPYLNDVTRHDHGITVRAPSWGTFSTSLDFRKKINEATRQRDFAINSVRFDLDTHMYGPWFFNATYRYDYERNEEVERSVNLIYRHQCFEVITQASYDTGEYSYQMMILLKGLGD